MKKKLAILGTNEYQNPLIIRAKQLGYETHVFGWKTGEIGERTADFYYPINVLDHEALWNQVQQIGVCGAAMIASETIMPSFDFLLRKLNIPCNSLECEHLCLDKYAMRCAMRDAGIEGPQFIESGEDFDPEQIKEFKFPLIVKPADATSSRGVSKVEKLEDVRKALDYALSWSKSKRAMVEEYVDGPEYSGDSIAYEGKYKLLAVTEKHTTGAPHFVETGHRQPARLAPDMYRKVEETLYKAFAALKIEYGAVHPEFRITADGKIYFMEIGARMGGDCIGSDLVPLSTGYDYMGMVISIGCGHEPCFEKICEPHTAAIKYIITEQDLNEYKRMVTEEPERIIRSSEIKLLSEKPILQSSDRAGYYIFIK